MVFHLTSYRPAGHSAPLTDLFTAGGPASTTAMCWYVQSPSFRRTTHVFPFNSSKTTSAPAWRSCGPSGPPASPWVTYTPSSTSCRAELLMCVDNSPLVRKPPADAACITAAPTSAGHDHRDRHALPLLHDFQHVKNCLDLHHASLYFYAPPDDFFGFHRLCSTLVLHTLPNRSTCTCFTSSWRASCIC